MDLKKMSCSKCTVESPIISIDEAEKLMQIIPSWALNDGEFSHMLTREYMFKNFTDAVKFSVKIAELADEQDHHPKLIIEWGKVSIFWWTHLIKGLHLNDFIMAAKADALALSMK